MSLSPQDKQTAVCKSLYEWLVRLAMKTTLCVMWS